MRSCNLLALLLLKAAGLKASYEHKTSWLPQDCVLSENFHVPEVRYTARGKINALLPRLARAPVLVKLPPDPSGKFHANIRPIEESFSYSHNLPRMLEDEMLSRCEVLEQRETVIGLKLGRTASLAEPSLGLFDDNCNSASWRTLWAVRSFSQ
jgi:hypothetical protein